MLHRIYRLRSATCCVIAYVKNRRWNTKLYFFSQWFRNEVTVFSLLFLNFNIQYPTGQAFMLQYQHMHLIYKVTFLYRKKQTKEKKKETKRKKTVLLSCGVCVSPSLSSSLWKIGAWQKEMEWAYNDICVSFSRQAPKVDVIVLTEEFFGKTIIQNI